MRLDAAGFKGHIAAVTEDEVEPADSADHEKEHQEPPVRWGTIASVLAHIPLVALLIFGLPKIQPKPAEDESVKVELVPPPEEKKRPEEKLPEPKPPEEAKKQTPPPPPPSVAKKAREQAKPMPTLTPVIEFGDENSGPQKSLAGNSSRGEAKPPTAPPQRDPESKQAPAQAATAERQSEMPPSTPVPDDLKLPEVAAADVSARSGPRAEVSGDAKTNIEPAKPPEQKPSEESNAVAKNNDLSNAKTLFSRTADGSSIAQTAIDGLPRRDRVATLCASELGGQLANGSPRYSPFALPNRPLLSGTVLNVDDDAAFGTAKGWYYVRFRCEVDENATKVVSFAYKVGGLIPRSQYAKYKIRE